MYVTGHGDTTLCLPKCSCILNEQQTSRIRTPDFVCDVSTAQKPNDKTVDSPGDSKPIFKLRYHWLRIIILCQNMYSYWKIINTKYNSNSGFLSFFYMHKLLCMACCCWLYMCSRLSDMLLLVVQV